MKRLNNKWISLASILLFVIVFSSSCKKTIDQDLPAPTENRPHTIGKSIGEVYSEFIDAEGGVIKSPDGAMEIIIPANALSEPTEIGIEPIENTCSAGIGIAYRITPHDKTFNKPVTIRFSYDGMENEVIPEALTVAFQDKNGVWKTGSSTVLNKSDKTVQVQSTHFSDWSFIETLKLLPPFASVKPGGQVKLTAVSYVERGDDFLVPLDGTVVTNEKPVDSRLIKRWYVAGAGRGTISPAGNQATYTAPDNEGDAFVTCELNIQGRQVLLIAYVTIMEEGIRISIDGAPYVKYPGLASIHSDGFISIANIATTIDQPQFKLFWRISAATAFPWNDNALFQMAMIKDQINYTSSYEEGNDIRHSRGRLRVRESEGDGKKYLLGTAYIHPSGVISTVTGKQVRTAEVAAEFRVQKTW